MKKMLKKCGVNTIITDKIKMKKLFTIFILLSAIVGGLSSAYAQSLPRRQAGKHSVTQIHKNTEALQKANNQQELLSSFNKQTSFISPIKKTIPELKTKSLIQINDSIYYWQWDTISIGWVIYYKDINIVYDAHNNITSELRKFWNGSAWDNPMLRTYTYDANNNQTSDLQQHWNGSTWGNSFLLTYTYDAHNNQTSFLLQNWNGSAWVNSNQYIYTYDVNNNQTSYLSQSWNGSAWVVDHDQEWKDTYTYDVNNNLTSELDQDWNGSTWVNSYQYTGTYDVNNNITSVLGKSWNGSAWVNSEQSIYTYDVNNNMTSYLYQSWNGSAWVNSNQNTHAYDANNFTKSDTYKSWNSNGTIVTYGDSTFYYFHTITGVNDLIVQGENITIYPNPATEIVSFKIDNRNNADLTLNIYNVTGTLVKSETLRQNQRQINIRDLSNGIYMVEIKTKEWTGKQKLIIQR